MAISKVIYKSSPLATPATWMDATPATATAADITAPKTAMLADGVLTTGTGSGGGGGSTPAPKKDVNFLDYDGTIVYSYTAAEAANLSALPANPTHAGLTSQGWNYTLAQMKTEVTAQGRCDIGQMYTTDDGATRIYCRFEEGRRNPYFGICVNGEVEIDWGDGSAKSTMTGSSLTTVVTEQHLFPAGDCMISIKPSTGSTFAFYGVSNTSHILKKSTATTASISRVYTNCVRKIELGTGANIGNYAFNYCYSLTSITITSDLTSIGNYAFYNCCLLKSITIPSGVTSIGSDAFNYCYGFVNITIPSNVTSISYDMFRYSYALASITIASGVTSISSYAFQNCYSLSNITIPPNVTSISGNAFSTCYGLGEIHFKPTTPPTVASSNAFSSVPTDCIIYVPSSADHSVLAAYQSATNYPSSSSYTYMEE